MAHRGGHMWEKQGQFGSRRSKGKIRAKPFLLFSQKRMSKAESKKAKQA